MMRRMEKPQLLSRKCHPKYTVHFNIYAEIIIADTLNCFADHIVFIKAYYYF